jgi:hypothetical protein
MFFGMNQNTELILALIKLKKCDIERFRDCDIDYSSREISIYTRTGGGNREDYPNELLLDNSYYKYDEDDEYDSTYATFYFEFPKEIAGDIL